MENKKKSALLLCLFKHLVTGTPLFGVRLLTVFPVAFSLLHVLKNNSRFPPLRVRPKNFSFLPKLNGGMFNFIMWAKAGRV